MAPAPTERLAIVAPELFVSDVDASIEFYQRLAARPCVRTRGSAPPPLRRDADGRGRDAARPPAPCAATSLKSGELRGAGLDVRIIVDDVDACYARAKVAGATIEMGLGDRSDGLRDFKRSDRGAFVVRFASIQARG